MVNQLKPERRAEILAMLCEGASMRGVTRSANVSINTVTKLLIDAGTVCAAFHEAQLRGLCARQVRCDKVWSNIATTGQRKSKAGKIASDSGVWTWIAQDCDHELVLAAHVGALDAMTARHFMQDVARHLASRGAAIDDAQAAALSATPAPFLLGPDAAGVQGNVCGTFIPAQAPPAFARRVSARRFTRLRNAYSKKPENFRHMIAIYLVWHNFICRSRTGVSRAMAAGVTGRVWEWADVIALIDAGGHAARQT